MIIVNYKEKEKVRILESIRKQISEYIEIRNKEKKDINKIESKRIESEGLLANLINDQDK